MYGLCTHRREVAIDIKNLQLGGLQVFYVYYNSENWQ
jgi:hypothetical protein